MSTEEKIIENVSRKEMSESKKQLTKDTYEKNFSEGKKMTADKTKALLEKYIKVKSEIGTAYLSGEVSEGLIGAAYRAIARFTGYIS